jgi:hypothetical protein
VSCANDHLVGGKNGRDVGMKSSVAAKLVIQREGEEEYKKIRNSRCIV